MLDEFPGDTHIVIFLFKNAFTVLSNIQSYTTLKLSPVLIMLSLCFGDLQNYTTLKHQLRYFKNKDCFGDLQNYTTLKQYEYGYIR